jgi:hypothetical protein
VDRKHAKYSSAAEAAAAGVMGEKRARAFTPGQGLFKAVDGFLPIKGMGQELS